MVRNKWVRILLIVAILVEGIIKLRGRKKKSKPNKVSVGNAKYQEKKRQMRRITASLSVEKGGELNVELLEKMLIFATYRQEHGKK